MRLLALAGLAPTITALACGAGGGTPVAEYQSELETALCTYLARCSLFVDQTSCLAYEQSIPSARVSPNYEPLIAAGRATFDPVLAQQCVDRFAGLSCATTDVTSALQPAGDCAQPVDGLGSAGDECAQDDECQSRRCATAACGSACCAATCLPPLPPAQAGSSCDDTDCGSGLACVDGMCAVLGSAGDPCANPMACQPPLGCGSAGTCVALPALGQPCTGQCADYGATCNHDGTCVALGLLGDSCADAACSPYYTCDPATMKCAAPPAAGQMCGAPDGGARCAPDAYCTQQGSCAALLADGASCTDADDCASNYCDGTCKAAPVCL